MKSMKIFYNEKIKKKDKEEIASITQNLYLTYVSERNFEKALECAEKVID